METPKLSLSELIIEDSLRNTVKYYGIEGCEEAIHRVYALHPATKALVLSVFCRIYKKNS